MNRLFLILFIPLMLISYEPKVYVTVNNEHIYKGEEFRVKITVRAPKDSKIEFPEVKNIAGYPIKKVDKKQIIMKLKENDEDILVVKKSIRFTLFPTNNFTVKPFIVKIDDKEYKTKPVKIKIIKEKKRVVKDFKFNLSINKKSSYKKEAILATVKLAQPIDIIVANLDYTPPKFKDFDVITLGDGEVVKQGNMLIREIDYIIKPKKSGRLTISSAIAKMELELAPQMQGVFGFFGPEVQIKHLSTKPITIDVKPIPNGVELVGDYKINIEVKNRYIKKNKPYEFILKIDGVGDLTGIKLKKLDIKNSIIYEKPSKIERKISNNKIFTRFSKKYIIVSNSDFTIPIFKFNAFNPKTKEKYILSTKPILVKIKKDKKIVSILSSKKENNITIKMDKSVQNMQIKQKKDNLKISNIKIDKNQEVLFDINYYKRKLKELEDKKISQFLTYILGLISGVLIAIYLPILIKLLKNRDKKSKLYNSYEEALNILYPHITESVEIEEMVKLLYEVINGNNEIKIDNKKLDRLIENILYNRSF